jgi:tetratricopeptide (TPR) repeat protein
MPVEEAIARCVDIAAEQPGDRSLEAVSLGVRALLEAMRGRFDEARRLYDLSHSILDELGQYRLLAAMRTYAGTAELLAGDTRAAERELRASADAVAEIGDQANLSTIAAYLADAVAGSGRDDEAFELTLVSEQTASAQDAASQVLWRLARAALCVQRRQLAEAQRLASEADALACETDALNLQGDAALRLSEVLSASGRPDEAAAAAERAVERYEAKGNVVSAAQARALVSAVPGARA